MPIIAVAAAAISIGSVGAAGFGAILAGTASIGTMFAGVAAVGATLGAIGEIAGIKELKTAGLVLGGIGGVGSIAAAVGAFGSGATMSSVFGSGSAVTETALAPAAGLDAASLINSSGINSSIIDPVTGAVTNSASAAASGVVDTANNIGGFANAGADNLSDVVKVPGISDTATKVAEGASDALKPVTENIMEGPDSSTNEGTPTAKTGSTDLAGNVTGKVDVPNGQDGGGGAFGKNGFFNTLGGMGVVQAAGSFLSGAFDPLKPAQADAYKAQAAANNAAAALQNKQNSNMSEPIPIARRTPVTGKIGGMINSTPPTGAMA